MGVGASHDGQRQVTLFYNTNSHPLGYRKAEGESGDLESLRPQ